MDPTARKIMIIMTLYLEVDCLFNACLHDTHCREISYQWHACCQLTLCFDVELWMQGSKLYLKFFQQFPSQNYLVSSLIEYFEIRINDCSIRAFPYKMLLLESIRSWAIIISVTDFYITFRKFSFLPISYYARFILAYNPLAYCSFCHADIFDAGLNMAVQINYMNFCATTVSVMSVCIWPKVVMHISSWFST